MDIVDAILTEIERKIRNDLSSGGLIDIKLSVRDMCRMEWEQIKEKIDHRFDDSKRARKTLEEM